MDDVATLFYTLVYSDGDGVWYGELCDEQGHDKGWTNTFDTREEAERASREMIEAKGCAPRLLKVLDE
jgi:hypothetical protein